MTETYECLSCKHQVAGSPFKHDGTHCEKCDGPLTEVRVRPKLSVEIKAMDLEVVKQLSQALIDVSKDQRIPLNVREELMDKVHNILDRKG